MNPFAAAEGTVTIGPEWLQGRTAYGGASAAVALSAALELAPDLPPLRSVQIAFVGPLAGAIQPRATLLRRGKNSAFIAVDLLGEAGLGLRALFLFMASRPSAIANLDLPMARIDPPVARPHEGYLPGFLANFELGSRHDEGVTMRRWVRVRRREGLNAALELVLIADALPPAAMLLAPAWGPISTTTWQLNVLTDAPASPDGWWLIEARSLQSGDGSSSQAMTIWNSDGAPQATATQNIALFV